MRSFREIGKYFELASFIAYLFILGAHLYSLFDNNLSMIQMTVLFFMAVLVGYILADFTSGVIHWMADRYGSVRLWFFGPQFILPFRAHHIFPQDMTKLNFLENIGNSCFMLNIFLGLAFLIDWPAGSSLVHFFLSSLVVVFAGVLALANLFHKWAHSQKVPKFAQVLQKYRIILPPIHHNIHHVAPYETHYCIVSGWCNRFLSKIRFFERVEKTVYSVFGLKGGDYDLEEVKKEYHSLIDIYFKRDKKSAD